MYVCVIYENLALDSHRLMEAQVVERLRTETTSARRRRGTRSGQTMRRGGNWNWGGRSGSSFFARSSFIT